MRAFRKNVSYQGIFILFYTSFSWLRRWQTHQACSVQEFPAAVAKELGKPDQYGLRVEGFRRSETIKTSKKSNNYVHECHELKTIQQ